MKKILLFSILFFTFQHSFAQLTVTTTAANSAICLGDSTSLTATAFPVTYSINAIANNPIPSPGFQSTVLVDQGVLGTSLSSGTLDDGRWDNINLPFTFRYFGNDYNSVNISTNGWIGLGSLSGTSTGVGVTLPNAAAPNNVIHAISADLNFKAPTTSSLEYFYEGSSPNTKFIIRFNNLKFFNTTGTANVEVILYETTNEIDIHTTDCTNTTLPKAQGIENSTGTVAIVVPGRNNVKIWSGMPDAYRFSPDQFTYTWSPTSGLTNNIKPKVSAHPAATTTYTVNAVNTANAQSGSTTIAVNINNTSYTLATTVAGNEVCQNKVISAGLTYFRDGNCSLITSIQPSGSNPVNNSINACVTIYSAPGNFSSSNFYAARKYDIKPIINSANATATITLYYLQSEFDSYNSRAASNNVKPLPTGPTDIPGLNNLVVRQFHGTGTNPTNYTGTSVDFTTAIPGFNVTWNSSYNWWEVIIPVTGFSGFYLTTLPANALPISLLYFKGTQSGNNHLLNWKVNCLSTRVKFEIENSLDGIHFLQIGKIEADKVRCAQPFDFINSNPLAGMNYYRIKISDIDGKFYYSTIVSLIEKTKGFKLISLTPNPVRNADAVLKINSGQSENINLIISDMLGKIISLQQIHLASGINEVIVNTKQLSAGIYNLSGFTPENKSQTLRFIKQ